MSIEFDHALQMIGIVVAVTSAIITATCALALKWINTMREDFCALRIEFREFVKMYYEKHEETMKRDDCVAKHALIESKVDDLADKISELERAN